MSLPRCQTATTAQALSHQRGSTSPPTTHPSIPSPHLTSPSHIFRPSLKEASSFQNCAVTLISLSQTIGLTDEVDLETGNLYGLFFFFFFFILGARDEAESPTGAGLLGALGVLAQRCHHVLRAHLAMLGAAQPSGTGRNRFQGSSDGLLTPLNYNRPAMS